MEVRFRESPEFEVINVERLKRSSEAVSRARELVSQAQRQIEVSMELVEELQANKSCTELLRTIFKTRTDARKASREWAKALKNEAQRLRNPFTRLRRATPRATDGHRLKRQLTAGAEAVSALRQTLSALESVRMTLPNDPTLQKLKTDIRKAIARSEVSITTSSGEREDSQNEQYTPKSMANPG